MKASRNARIWYYWQPQWGTGRPYQPYPGLYGNRTLYGGVFFPVLFKDLRIFLRLIVELTARPFTQVLILMKAERAVHPHTRGEYHGSAILTRTQRAQNLFQSLTLTRISPIVIRIIVHRGYFWKFSRYIFRRWLPNSSYLRCQSMDGCPSGLW